MRRTLGVCLPGVLCAAVLRVDSARVDILLRHGRIATAPAVQTFARTRNPDDKISIAPPGSHTLSRRGTLPYLVQFAGPVQPAWRELLRDQRVTVHDYVPRNALIVECAPQALAQLAALECVQWIGEYRPEYKCDSLNCETETWRDITIQTFAAADTNEVAARLHALGGAVLAAGGLHKGIVRARVPGAAVDALAAMAEVEWIEPYQRPFLLSDIAVQRRRLNVEDAWHVHGLSGAGQVIALADTGLDMGVDNATLHPDFRGRVTYGYCWARDNVNDWSDEWGHGTHCAGDALGNGAASGGRFKGPAYLAQIIVQCTFDVTPTGYVDGIPADLNTLFQQAYTNGARIHSDSWGITTNGAYTTAARMCDEFTWNNKDMLIAFAAGNSGVDKDKNAVTDPGSLNAPATAKNVLAVGASENLRAEFLLDYWWYPQQPLKHDRYTWPYDGTNQGMAAFSSRGPCVDGRTKPDLVAPGTGIIAARSRMPGTDSGDDAYDASYCYRSGTSMATPLAAGCAALVRQCLAERRGIANPSAALVKALLINGARTLSPGQFGTGAYREIPAGARPNNVEGWGQISLAHTLFPPAGSTVIVHDTYALVTGASNLFTFTAPGGAHMSVTLAWTDYPSAVAAAINLVNDLDLRVITPGGTVLHPNGLAQPDRLNNVEGIDLATAASGTYTIIVYGHNVPHGPQPYALAVRSVSAPQLAYAPAQIVLETGPDAADTAALVITNPGTGPLSYDLSVMPPNYDAQKSTDSGAPPFAWLDISGSGTTLTLGDNDSSLLIPFGFPFPFFGQHYTHFSISANGAVTLGAGAVPAANAALPTTTVTPPLIAPFWDDLAPHQGGSILFYRTSAYVAVTWQDIPRANNITHTQTFQLVAYPSGAMVFNYHSMRGTTTSATIGLQHSATGAFFQLAYNQTYVQNNFAVRITPPSWLPWLSIAPASGSVPPRGSVIALLTGSAAGMDTGSYPRTVLLQHDDLTQPEKEISVRMEVLPEPRGVLVLALLCRLHWFTRRHARR